MESPIAREVTVTIPAFEGEEQGLYESVDMTIVYPDKPGQMRRFREFCDYCSNQGWKVELRERTLQAGPVADITAPNWKLTVLGPDYSLEAGVLKPPRREQEAIRLAMEAAITRDDAEPLVEEAKDLVGQEEDE